MHKHTRLNLGPFPNNSNINTSIIVTKLTPRLHNYKTNWVTYRQIVQCKVTLSIKRKEHKDIEPKLTTYSIYSSMLPKKLYPSPSKNK